MGCFKQLSIAQATSTGDGEFMHEAVYVSSVGKIFGTSGSWLLKYNATTGAKESATRLGAPLYGECRLTLASDGFLYATLNNEPNRQWFSLAHPNRDIVKINPTTLAITPLNINTNVFGGLEDFTNGPYWGPMAITTSGNYLYFIWQSSSGGKKTCKINVTNLADNASNGDGTLVFHQEQLSIDAANTYLFVPDPWNREIDRVLLDFSSSDFCDLSPYNPIACEHCVQDGKQYAVNGDGTMIRIDNFGAGTISAINLDSGAVIVGTPGSSDPCRLRHKVGSNLIYIPCPTSNGIAVYDVIAGTGTWKSGFDNPIDIVFTPSKVFAVQNAAVGLKEIT